MKNKTAVLLVVALVCGLGAAFLTARLIADRGKPAPEEKVEVVVAKKSVPQHKVLKDPNEFFVTKQVSKNDAPKNAVTRLEDLKGKRLKVPLGEDKYVTKDDVLDDKNGGGLAPLVPEGYVAFAVETNGKNSVAGFIQPQAKVDIIATLKRTDTKSAAQTILQDVLVLAVGNTLERDPNTQSLQAPTVTLALKPEEAQKLALAADVASLRLVLRGSEDTEQRKTKPTMVIDVLEILKDAEDAENAKAGNAAQGGKPSFMGLPIPAPGSSPAPKPVILWSIEVREGDRVRWEHYTRNQKGEIVRYVEPADKPAPDKVEGF